MIMTRTIGGAARRFELLTVSDLETISDTIPNPSGEIIDLRGLNKWANSPRGCERFLFVSAKKCDPLVTADAVAKWGTIAERVALATDIFMASLSSGEESPGPNASGGPTNPPTGK